MAPKRLIFISPVLLLDDFSSQEQEGRFYQEFASKTILEIHTLDAKGFQE